MGPPWEEVWRIGARFAQLGSGLLLLVRSRRPPWGPHVFASPTRQRILELLIERDAIPLAELRHRIASGWGHLDHHLKQLTEAGLVRLETHDGRRVVVSELADVAPRMVRAVALLRHPPLRRIATHIVRHPDCTIRDICEATGASRRVAYYHVKKLRDANLLRSPVPRRYFELKAGPELVALLGEDARKD